MDFSHPLHEYGAKTFSDVASCPVLERVKRVAGRGRRRRRGRGEGGGDDGEEEKQKEWEKEHNALGRRSEECN